MQTIAEMAVNKEFLRSIADNEYAVPAEIDCFAFAKALLNNLGSTDSELRDELSYLLLASGIIDKQKLTPLQLEVLLGLVIDTDHLFEHIGSVGTDAVFMRSFSCLIVAAILYTDTKTPQLPGEVIQQTKAALFQYARQEKDWRGYPEGKGWAHAMAHLADALDECAQHTALSRVDREEVLMLVGELAKLPKPLYHEEDIRLAKVAYHIIVRKQVEELFLSSWVEECFVLRDPDLTTWTRATNSRNFMRSLYFLLMWNTMAISLAEKISGLLKKQDEIYLEKGEG